MSGFPPRTGLSLLPAMLAMAACGDIQATTQETDSPGALPEWTAAAPFPETRTEVSAASDGRRLFVAGGFGPVVTSGVSAPRTLWAYDPATDGWTREGEIPEGVNHAGFVHLGGKLFLVGGFRENTFEPTDAVRVYDLSTRQWSSGSPIPTPRGAAAVVVLANRIHVIGGNVPGSEAVHEHERGQVTADNSAGTHEVYDPATNSWSRLAPMPTSRNHLGAAAVGNRIYAVGGRANGEMRLTVVEIFDAATGAWQAGPPIPTGRSGIAVVERDGMVYVFGGEATRTFDDAERFDPATGTWARLTPMPTARHGLGAAVIGDQIHVISGGPNPGFSFGNAHEKLGPG